jgi:glutaconate CoA-transferase subunit A
VVGSKLCLMKEAIARIPDGASVCLGASLEACIPFAAGHELIRQGKRDLTVIGPISDVLFDQMIGAGCVRRVVAAWAGNVSAGLGHNYRRAVEQGVPRSVEVEDHSNFTVALGLLAGALGAPYIPTRSLLGSDLLASNPALGRGSDPWTGEPLVLVRALRPDVAILHVQRADEAGSAQAWGPLGVAREAALAARAVVLVAEEVVPAARLLAEPDRLLAPPLNVVAVVHEPWGAYPSPVQDFYGRDHDAFARYHDDSRSADGFRAWLERFVLGVSDRRGLLDLVGEPTLRRLAAAGPSAGARDRRGG